MVMSIQMITFSKQFIQPNLHTRFLHLLKIRKINTPQQQQQKRIKNA